LAASIVDSIGKVEEIVSARTASSTFNLLEACALAGLFVALEF
jgi:hypothetical protein